MGLLKTKTEQNPLPAMHQNSVSKKRRSDRGNSKRVTVMVPGHEAAGGTRVAPLTPRLCLKTEHSPTMSPRSQSDWKNNRGPRQENSLPKIPADARCPEIGLNERVADRGKVSALPLIKKGAGKVTALSFQDTGKNTNLAPALKASSTRGNQKSQPILASDMTPWVRASPSETSLTCLLHSIPSPKTCPDNIADYPQSQRESANKDNWSPKASPHDQPPSKDKANGKAKLRGRNGVTKRRSFNKFHNIKLPPVPAVTELNFSRNFSFSFFELPQHQGPQHWLLRQKYVYMVMRQLQ
ncbi:uncharacterized protein ACNLHF_027368 [Anomaloglossus baeobatrachus]|uniref:uncharacterized protein LOC142249132 n=1 Tax=Anomaloglossus baeobatrachus TaxID=238106 RepID=UPI003F50BC6F